MSEKDQAANCDQNKQLRVECALGTPEQIGWHNAGITMLETFTMKETGWFFCVVAGNSKDNTVKLNCEATGKGTISWTGTLEELFSEFERT